MEIRIDEDTCGRVATGTEPTTRPPCGTCAVWTKNVNEKRLKYGTLNMRLGERLRNFKERSQKQQTPRNFGASRFVFKLRKVLCEREIC